MLLRKLQAMKAKKGFTLVELIVVIAIIAVLAAILIPILMNYVTSSNISSAMTDAKNIHTAVAACITDLDTKGIDGPSANLTLSGATPPLTMTAIASSTYWDTGGQALVAMDAKLASDVAQLAGTATVFVSGGAPIAVYFLPAGRTIKAGFSPPGSYTPAGGWMDSAGTPAAAKPPERGAIFGVYPEIK